MAILSSDSELDPAARDAARKAKAGSARLRIALLRYGAKHGLPNLTRAECVAALRGRRRRPPRPRPAAKQAAGQEREAGRRAAPGAAGRGEGERHGTRG
jgi:hypothetical protein